MTEAGAALILQGRRAALIRCEFCYSVMNGEKLNLTKENPEECGVCVIRYEFDESEADDIQLVMTDGVSGGTTGHFHQAID